MRFVTGYLIVYFAIITGAVVALWSGGALAQIGVTRLTIALAVAVGLGVLLALASGWRPVRNGVSEETEER
jgi:membrane protein implicated in regulation of membrane protease activity